MNFFGFGQTADIEILFDDADERKVTEVKTDNGKTETLLLYYNDETVSGRVNVTLKKPGTKLEHQGIKVELIGQIELFDDRGNFHEFISLGKKLARPGDVLENTSYQFEFANVEKPYEVYTGANVRLRYFLRATIIRRLTDIVKEVDIAVHTLCSYPDEALDSIKMKVGIEDSLHVQFEYNKSKYHLADIILGKINFLLVHLNIKNLVISIIKKETTGSGRRTFTDNEIVIKYEILDGSPVRGESIPIRMFLAGLKLTPTMRDINNKFSVQYYINFDLIDTENRRYFKQQEITLWRKSDKSQLPIHDPYLPKTLSYPSQQIPRQMSASSEDSRAISPIPDNATQRPISPAMPDIGKQNGPLETEQEKPDAITSHLSNTHIDNDVDAAETSTNNIDEKSLEKCQVEEKLQVAEKPQLEKPVEGQKSQIAEKLVLSRPENAEANLSQ